MPRCAVSPDGRVLVIQDGSRVTVRELEPPGEPLSLSLPGVEGTLFVAGKHVVSLATGTASTRIAAVRIARSSRGMDPVELEIPLVAEVVAGSGGHVLLSAAGRPLVLGLSGDQLGYGPILDVAQIRWGVGLTDGRFLVRGERGLDIIDARTRRLVQRLRLDVPAEITAAGAASSGSNLWFATGGRGVEVVRISDGKRRSVVTAAPPRNVTGHVESSWIVADLDGAPHAINLVTGATIALGVASGRARAIVPRGADALLAQVLPDGELEIWEVTQGPRAQPDSPAAVAAPAATEVSSPPPVVPTRALVIALEGPASTAEPPTVALFTPPELGGRLDAIACRIRSHWIDAVVGGWLGGDALGRDAMGARLAAELRRCLLTEPIEGLVVAAAGHLVARVPVVADTPQAAWRRLWLSRGRVRREALALEAHALREIGHVLGMLVAGAAPGEVDAYARSAPHAARAFSHLVALDLLEPVAVPGTSIEPLPPGLVASLGGTTLLANLGGRHVLVDPVLTPAAATDPLPRPVVGDLPHLAAIFLTSDDPRCLDVPTLLALDKRVPIHVPPAPPGDRGPRVVTLLAELGFADVRLQRPGDAVAIGSGGEVRSISIDEAPPRLRARSALLLSHHGAAALATGSAVLEGGDASGLPAAVASLAGAGRISPLFVDPLHRPRAAIEEGWRWLFEPVEHWLRPRAPSHRALEDLVAASGGGIPVVHGGDSPVPAIPGARCAEAYDVYRLGGEVAGWIAPGGATAGLILG